MLGSAVRATGWSGETVRSADVGPGSDRCVLSGGGGWSGPAAMSWDAVSCGGRSTTALKTVSSAVASPPLLTAAGEAEVGAVVDGAGAVQTAA